MRTRFWLPAAPHQAHTDRHTMTWFILDQHILFLLINVVMMGKFYNWLSRKSVYVFTYICLYVCLCCCCVTVLYSPANRMNNPAPSKDPHLQSTGHDTYSESPKLSHTPWGQQRPMKKSERNREIGGGGGMWRKKRRRRSWETKLERGAKKSMTAAG